MAFYQNMCELENYTFVFTFHHINRKLILLSPLECNLMNT